MVAIPVYTWPDQIPSFLSKNAEERWEGGLRPLYYTIMGAPQLHSGSCFTRTIELASSQNKRTYAVKKYPRAAAKQSHGHSPDFPTPPCPRITTRYTLFPDWNRALGLWWSSTFCCVGMGAQLSQRIGWPENRKFLPLLAARRFLWGTKCYYF